MLIPIDQTFQTKGGLFYETSLHYKDVLDTYKHIKNELVAKHWPWTFVPIYDVLGVFTNQVSFFKTIEDNLCENDDYVVVAMGISSIREQNGLHPHVDNHPRDGRFKRMHLPLQLTPTSKINVLDDSGQYQEYKWSLGKWSEFDGVKYTHYPENLNDDERILLIIDIFVGEISDEDMLDYYQEIKRLGWVGDFSKQLSIYLKNKNKG